MMRLHTRLIAHTIEAAGLEGRKFVGVLFRFGEVSSNRTMVRHGAAVRVAGDAILVEHEYNTWAEYRPAGRIVRFYEKDGALLIEFNIEREDVLDRMRRGELGYLSVSWFGDDYSIVETHAGPALAFNEIVIYEVSLVSAPAFNTCIATEEEGLVCLSPSVHSGVHSGCGCGRKRRVKEKGNSVSLGDMVAKHQEVTRDEFAALVEQVNQIQEALAALTQEIDKLKAQISETPAEVIDELEQAKKRLSEVEIALSSQGDNIASVLAAVDKLVNITEKTYRNLPNLIQR